jgi:hypothetical protein
LSAARPHLRRIGLLCAVFPRTAGTRTLLQYFRHVARAAERRDVIREAGELLDHEVLQSCRDMATLDFDEHLQSACIGGGTEGFVSLCGYLPVSTGQFREIAIEANRIARAIQTRSAAR